MTMIDGQQSIKFEPELTSSDAHTAASQSQGVPWAVRDAKGLSPGQGCWHAKIHHIPGNKKTCAAEYCGHSHLHRAGSPVQVCIAQTTPGAIAARDTYIHETAGIFLTSIRERIAYPVWHLCQL